MKRAAIVTDTTACIPQELVAKYGIEVVPVEFIFGGKAYRDGLDIKPGEFYALLRKTDTLPTTSASSPQPYIEAYQKASRKAKSILCITEPSRFSAMYDSARVASDLVKTSLAGVSIMVLECTTAAAGQGLVALAAARKANSGANLVEVIETARSVMARVYLFATLDTLQYLVRSGRVPQAAALVNSLLKIKPIFTLNHGDAHTVALPRTLRSAVSRMLKIMGQRVAKGQPLHVAVMHADALEEAIRLKDRIASQFECAELFITEFTPVMGVHTGPGLLGIAFHNGD